MSGSPLTAPASSRRRATTSGVTPRVRACRAIAGRAVRRRLRRRRLASWTEAAFTGSGSGRGRTVQRSRAPFSGWLNYVDDEGSTSAGTTATGLHRVRGPIHHGACGTGRTVPEGAYPILQDRTGAIWVGNGRPWTAMQTGAGRCSGLRVPSPNVVSHRSYADRGRQAVGRDGQRTVVLRKGRYRPYVDSAGFLKRRHHGHPRGSLGSFLVRDRFRARAVRRKSSRQIHHQLTDCPTIASGAVRGSGRRPVDRHVPGTYPSRGGQVHHLA